MTPRPCESRAVRLYRAGLRLFPERLRRAHGDEMAAMFETSWFEARARGWRATASLVARTATDLLLNGTAARLSSADARHERPIRPMRRGREMGAMARATGMWQDLLLTTRRLLRAPLFVGVTLATLTIGLGMFAVAYSAVEKVLLEPMPYPHPGDLYYVWRDYGAIRDEERGALPGTDIAELQAAGGVIEDAVALQAFLGGVFSAGGDEDAMEISDVVSSPGLFKMLGVEPELGRLFGPDDAGPGRPFTMVLTHELWTKLGADPDVIGAEVTLNGRPHTVIGVLRAASLSCAPTPTVHRSTSTHTPTCAWAWRTRARTFRTTRP